jgi:phosphoglycerol transferase
VLAALALHLWDATWRVPFDYSGDATQNQVFIKGVLENGWYQHNPSLGAPLGQTLYDFPVISGDNLQILLIKALGIFTSDSALVMNLFFLLTFPLAALTAFASARLLGLTRPAAVVLATLFALLPYHFIRGEFHVFIGAYYAVPISAYLAITAMAGRGIFGWWPRERLRRGLREHRGRIAALALACLVIGSAHVYYAAFTVALLTIAAATRLVARTPRAAVMALGLAGVITAVVAVNHLPNILYRADHGVNSSLERSAVESETFGLKLAAMALPVPKHRLAPLARLRERYDDTAGDQRREGLAQALGSAATLGLAGLLLVALATLADAGRRARAGPLLLPLAATTLAAILLGSIGGLSSLFAYLVTPQLRAWGRISIFVAFFSLLAVLMAAESLRGRRPRAWLGALAAVLVIGFLDQTSAAFVPPYANIRAAYETDAEFVAGIQKDLGAGAAVFELPYEPFPEPQPSWIPQAGGYDLARGYLHSRGLRWSWGLMKGRAGDWESAVVQLPPELLARAVVAAGFDGVYLDRAGYADAGAYVLTRLQRETGATPTRSLDGRLVFLDLRRYAGRLRAAGPGRLAALRRAVLRPVTTQPGSGLSALRQDASSRYLLAEADATLVVINFGEKPRRVTVAMTLAPASPGEAAVQLRWPDGAAQRVRTTSAGTPVEHSMIVPPGASSVTLHTNGPAQVNLPAVSRPYYLRVLDPLVTDNAFDPFGPMPRDRRGAAYLSPFGVI